MRFLALILLFTLTLSVPAQFEVGLNINAPINGSGRISSYIDPAAIARLGVDTVRVNCILGPWSSPTDTSLFNGRTWFETYDAIVDGFLAEGIDSYLLIGSEAVAGSSRVAFAADAWTQSYAANFLAIVDHFRDRVSVYETFNEPNDWAGGTSSQVEPRWFAYQLQEIFLAVKYGPGGSHLGDSGYQNLTIVSGPLFAHDIGGTPSPQDGYWTQTRQAGINGDAAIPDLDWSSVHALTGSYPCDGIGYHIYVLGESDDSSAISTRYTQMLNAIWSTVTVLEGAGTAKQLSISEFGWNRDSLTTGLGAAAAPSAQGRNLETAMNLLRSDARVAQGHWFSLVDFGGIGDTWGVHSGATLADSNRNPAWWHLRWEGLLGDGTGNVAENAGFESGDLIGWTEWGDTDGVITGTWLSDITPHSGSHFHGTATNFGQRNGGLRQSMEAAMGERVTMGARVRTHREGGSEGDTACRIGIDPAGGTDPAAGTVVWSESLESEGFWRPLVVEAIATADTVTIFLEHQQAAPTWNITCFDDVAALTFTSVPREISVAPSTLSFGSWALDAGPSPSQIATVSNGGSEPLAITGVSLVGDHVADFSIVSDTGASSLDSGGSREVEVSFDPSVEGDKGAILRVTSDDADEPVVDVSLSGFGSSVSLDDTVEFGPDIDSLSLQPSDSDLIQSLTGVISQGGFHGGTGSQVGDLTDGLAPDGLAVLADYSLPSLQVTFDLGAINDITEVRVFSSGQDGRLFQNWGLDSLDGTQFTTIDGEVLSEPDGEFPSSLTNSGGSLAGAAVTSLAEAEGSPLGSARWVRITFQTVSEISAGAFLDPASAYVASTIAEIDVLGVSESGTPMGLTLALGQTAHRFID